MIYLHGLLGCPKPYIFAHQLTGNRVRTLLKLDMAVLRGVGNFV